MTSTTSQNNIHCLQHTTIAVMFFTAGVYIVNIHPSSALFSFPATCESAGRDSNGEGKL